MLKDTVWWHHLATYSVFPRVQDLVILTLSKEPNMILEMSQIRESMQSENPRMRYHFL